MFNVTHRVPRIYWWCLFLDFDADPCFDFVWCYLTFSVVSRCIFGRAHSVPHTRCADRLLRTATVDYFCITALRNPFARTRTIRLKTSHKVVGHHTKAVIGQNGKCGIKRTHQVESKIEADDEERQVRKHTVDTTGPVEASIDMTRQVTTTHLKYPQPIRTTASA